VETIIIAGEGFQAITASGDLSVWSGNDSFDFTLPNVVTKATITATYTTGFSQVQQVLDIGIGEQSTTPKPPSGPLSFKCKPMDGEVLTIKNIPYIKLCLIQKL